MAKTMKDAARTAIQIQDGCNLSGILSAFHTIMSEVIWPAARAAGKGTDWVNQHPVCTLFLDKLCDLNRRAEFDQAYDECVQLAEAGDQVQVAA